MAGAGQHGAGAAHVTTADICHRDDARASWSLLSLPAKAVGYQLARHIEPTAHGVECFCEGRPGTGGGHRLRRAGDVSGGGIPREAVFDWGTWAWRWQTVQPPELLARMKSRFGAYPLGLEAKRPAFRVPGRMEERSVRAVAYKAATAGWLLGQHDWISPSSGCVRRIRRVITCGRPAPRRSTRRMRRCSSRSRVYRAIDEVVGASANLASDVTLVVLSGDGVRPNRSAGICSSCSGTDGRGPLYAVSP